MYYNSKQLTERASQMEGFISIPEGPWICLVRMNSFDQKPNEFNDVAHIMDGKNLVFSTSCTTVPGLPALLGGYKRYNKKGACVLKADIWMNDSFAFGLHNGKMECLRQVENLWSTRDGNGNNKAEEYGPYSLGMWNTNIHAASYKLLVDFFRKLIGQWSYGCLVFNDNKPYMRMINIFRKKKRVSAIILNEFSV